MKMHPLLEEKNYLACDVEVAVLNVLQDYMENNVNSLPEHFSCKKTTKKGGFLVFGKETVMKSKSLKPSGNSITLWISGQCWSSENHAWWSSPSKPLLKIQRPLTIDVPLYGSVADYSIVTPKSMQAWCLKTVYMSMWILHRPSLVAGCRQQIGSNLEEPTKKHCCKLPLQRTADTSNSMASHCSTSLPVLENEMIIWWAFLGFLQPTTHAVIQLNTANSCLLGLKIIYTLWWWFSWRWSSMWQFLVLRKVLMWSSTDR